MPRAEVIEHMVTGNYPDYSRVIELSLKHAPGLVARYIPTALGTGSAFNRLTAAAVLALLDNDVSRRVLLSVLEASSDHDQTIECRAALRESTDPETREAADEWERAHPDDGKLNLQSMVLGSWGGCDKLLRVRMDALFDVVMKVRESLSHDLDQALRRPT